jgi:acetyltransferase-like isoleucine patch superfamily enzyme
MPFDPIISPNSRIRHPEQFTVGEGSVVDDFCYFSTQVNVGKFCHIASGSSVAGGRDRLFTLGDYSSLSSGVKIWCSSDDFARNLVILLPAGIRPIKEAQIIGDVTFGRYTAAGANSVIMPNNRIPDGTVIGALSYVPPEFEFEPWSVYAGSPVRKVNLRDRDAVLRQLEAFEKELERHRQTT